jgi:hypothetical protein
VPRQGGDTSVTGFQMQALQAGQLAGLDVPAATLQGAAKWLDSCETPDRGRYGYTGPNPTHGMTAAGLLCRMYLGAPARDPGLVKGRDWLAQTYPPGRTRNLYYEFYATQVMHHLGGASWERWNRGRDGQKGMRDLLVGSQDRDGSWDPKGDAYGPQGGRVMQTSLALLTLEVYYRHVPLYSGNGK